MTNEPLYIPASQRKGENMSPEEQIAARQAREKVEEEERAKAVRARSELLVEAADLLSELDVRYSATDIICIALFLEGKN